MKRPERREAVDLDRYLRRIGYSGPRTVDAGTLEALQRAHLFAVPFENLSIGWGAPITFVPGTPLSSFVRVAGVLPRHCSSQKKWQTDPPE